MVHDFHGQLTPLKAMLPDLFSALQIKMVIKLKCSVSYMHVAATYAESSRLRATTFACDLRLVHDFEADSNAVHTYLI